MNGRLTPAKISILADHSDDAREQHPILPNLAEVRLALHRSLDKLQASDVPLPNKETQELQGRRLLQVATIALLALDELDLPWSPPKKPATNNTSDSVS